ncbi:MAG: hypothetical protein GQ574_04900 [Crocinitomix sp.]|nr:hypothetical protein [Crocinitomix sp.]
MFGLEDLMKNVDLGDILEKVGLSDKDKKEVTNQAADAIKYRTNKEKARGNDGTMANLFSANDNNEDANKVAKKLEGDLAHNLKNKSGMSESIIDKIKSAVMSKVMGSFTGDAAKSGDKEGNGLMDMFTDNDMISGLKSKLGGFFK